VRYHKDMRLLKQLAVLVFWFFLWTAIPAALLYPFALWVEKHTRISGYAVAQGYVAAICLLFLPTGFLIDFMYRHFVRDRHASKSLRCE
jgi:predicted PurR-regulated permease PerM